MDNFSFKKTYGGSIFSFFELSSGEEELDADLLKKMKSMNLYNSTAPVKTRALFYLDKLFVLQLSLLHYNK
jgi:hypothetical protein